MAQYDLVLTQNVAATGNEFTERLVTLAKGTLVSANASNVPVALAAGTNGHILSRDDAEVTGLKWIAISANFWQRNSTVLSPATTGDTLTIDSITVPITTGKYVFGDGDSYFYESSDDQIMVYLAAAARWRFTTGQFRQDSNGGPAMQAEGSSATNPVFCPINSDSNTGIGGAATEVSVIVSSTEILKAAATVVTVNTALYVTGTLTTSAFVISAAGWATTVMSTSGSIRWSYGKNNTAESGGNAGSNFVMYGFNDAGDTIVCTPITITRATGLVTMTGGLKIDIANAATGRVWTATDNDGNGDWQAAASGVTLAGGVDNRVVTATGASALNGESNLTFDGTNLILASASGTFAFQSVTHAFKRESNHLRVFVTNILQQAWYDDETVFYSKITNNNGIFQTGPVNLELRTGGVEGYHASIIPGFKSTSGSAGNLYLQRGLGGSGAAHGGIYFGNGTTGHLAVVSGDTNVVYYNTTTGKLSYGSVSGGTTINNNADNRVITGSNTANTLEGEATLTYSAGSLSITAGATRYFTVGSAAASTNADDLIIRAGIAPTSGYTGGRLYLLGGDAGAGAQSGNVYIFGGTTGTVGNVFMCFNGTTAYGSVGIRVAPSTSYSLRVAGEVYSDDDFRGANFILNSDIRLKQNVVALKPEYLDIDYSQFEFITKPDQVRFGVIAQQVREKYPELVREKEGELAVAYTDLLIREIAYLKDKVKELERRMD